jgi:DNA-binding transcriptional MerR regulator
MPDDDRYTLTELADLAGVTPRTVRYYLGQGLLPAVGQSGPGAKYGAGHLARLRVIRRLQNEHLPLAEIRRRLEGLDDATVIELAGAEEPPPSNSALEYLRGVLGGGSARDSEATRLAAPAPAPDTPASLNRIAAIPGASAARLMAPGGRSIQAPEATAEAIATPQTSQWDRIVLAPDVELHVRRPLTRPLNKAVDRLVTIARELLEEDPS